MYCNEKGHTETVCFSKCDDEKLSKLAEKCTLHWLTAYNKEAMDSILNKLKSLYLKGKG